VKGISLFSGCGGLDLGASLAGVKIVFANDSNKFAMSSHGLLHPGVSSVLGPIEDISDFPTANLVMGGYPCQSFSMGGRRAPESDDRSQLYQHYVRVLKSVQPEYFLVENVAGLKALENGSHFAQQLRALSRVGIGYYVTWAQLKSENYGVPQKRRRVFVVGVRRDLRKRYHCPLPTHGLAGCAPFVSHGDAISGLPLWPEGEFYERSGGEADNFPWYYMSRNRKARWESPAFTVVANWRHISIHPASPLMNMTWSNLSDGFKQRWDFSTSYDHLVAGSDRPILERPRRLSWRECALIQSFPKNFVPDGTVQSKYEQIGNAVPPLLAKVLIRGLVDGSALLPINSRTPIISNGDFIQARP
jgi:DNA (cytosine-5)-methyltransferase 1